MKANAPFKCDFCQQQILTDEEFEVFYANGPAYRHMICPVPAVKLYLTSEDQDFMKACKMTWNGDKR